jgi:hypothetical protein
MYDLSELDTPQSIDSPIVFQWQWHPGHRKFMPCGRVRRYGSRFYRLRRRGSYLLFARHFTTRSSFQTNATRTFHSTAGTTIVGCLVGLGRLYGTLFVILGADTKATDDRVVADKRCEKNHRISTNVFCCGAGTSADLEALT